MTVRLAVAGAFHTEYMAPAVEKLKEALAKTEIKAPRIPVISNVDAEPHSDPAVIREILAKQVGGVLGSGHCLVAGRRVQKVWPPRRGTEKHLDLVV